jgi:hypothetical protein
MSLDRFEQIEKKIKQMGLFVIDEEREIPENPEEILQQIEKEYKLSLPIEYKKFVVKYGGLMIDYGVYFPVLEKSPRTTSDGTRMIDIFYGLQNNEDNLRKKLEAYKDRMPSSIIPIGELPGGDQLCLGVKGDIFGKVYIWDHENELVAKLMIGYPVEHSDLDRYWDNLYLVAESLFDFINSLEKSDD